jgi:hypothetical protein
MTVLAPPRPGRLANSWPGVALTANQLSLMGANLLMSVLLAYAGGLPAVGAVAPGVLVFQFGCGVLQQVLGEASLLAEARSDRAVGLDVCRWAVGIALLGGFAGAVIAAAATATVPHGAPMLGLLYALGIPAAHVLDIGRAAAIAHHQPRPAALEAVAWGLALTVGAGAGAVTHRPEWICAAWAIVSWGAMLVTAATTPARRPRLRQSVAWLRSQHRFAGPATMDAILMGITPLLATQLAAFVTSAAVIGAIRIVQQLFAPLAFVSITARKVLIYRRSPDQPVTRGSALRAGLIAAAMVAMGAAVLGAALFFARAWFGSLAFIPAGGMLILAGLEKIAQGLTFGVSLGKFVARDFRMLLRARYAFVAVSLAGLPLLAYAHGASGFLIGSAAASTLYALILLAMKGWDR